MAELLRDCFKSVVQEAVFHCPPKYSERALQTAYIAGLRRGTSMFEGGIIVQVTGVDILGRNEEDGPLYSSLDGSEVINNSLELITSIGKNPEDAAVRIGTILKHSDKRELEIQELETLRKARAVIESTEIPVEIFCQEGQGMIEKLMRLTNEYESSFKQKK